MSIRSVIAFIVYVAVAFVPSLFGWQSRPGQWYHSLVKPAGTPPSWVFPVVWTTLYMLMGVALYLVWRRTWGAGQPSGLAVVAFVLFAVQLALNAAWSPIFFGWHRIGWALIDLAALWVFIVLTLVAFWRVATPAGLLLVPYLLWVSYAGYLNWGLWRLNN